MELGDITLVWGWHFLMVQYFTLVCEPFFLVYRDHPGQANRICFSIVLQHLLIWIIVEVYVCWNQYRQVVHLWGRHQLRVYWKVVLSFHWYWCVYVFHRQAILAIWIHHCIFWVLLFACIEFMIVVKFHQSSCILKVISNHEPLKLMGFRSSSSSYTRKLETAFVLIHTVSSLVDSYLRCAPKSTSMGIFISTLRSFTALPYYAMIPSILSCTSQMEFVKLMSKENGNSLTPVANV